MSVSLLGIGQFGLKIHICAQISGLSGHLMVWKVKRVNLLLAQYGIPKCQISDNMVWEYK